MHALIVAATALILVTGIAPASHTNVNPVTSTVTISQGSVVGAGAGTLA